jgi:hypothetical protein
MAAELWALRTEFAHAVPGALPVGIDGANGDGPLIVLPDLEAPADADRGANGHARAAQSL